MTKGTLRIIIAEHLNDHVEKLNCGLTNIKKTNIRMYTNHTARRTRIPGIL